MKKRSIVIFAMAIALLTARYAVTDFHNYPNPFTPELEATSFVVAVSENGATNITEATLTLYNTQGRVIFTREDIPQSEMVADPHQTNQLHITSWRGVDQSGKDVPRGIYYAKVDLTTGDGDIITAYTKTVVK